MSTYTDVAHFAQTWGLVYFFVVFLGVVAYAVWPSNSRTFDKAAHIPLRED